MKTRSRLTRLSCVASASILLPVSVVVFALGFFPYKPLLPGLAEFQTNPTADASENALPGAVFDRVIFMVVDALRSDFVFAGGSGFGFTQSLIRDGAAIPFTAFAAPPTVTMPRIKALTTGSVPSFADLIFNLDESDTGSSLAGQDTWLAQIKARGGRLVFYGDDTWLRLFPGDFFARAEGTSSFFVSDFTEVDNNVTRHIPRELQQSDWNAMIVHYLGLDHIGHKTGPRGPNMLPKQQEMDAVVQEIYEASIDLPHLKNTLLVVAGDHGMNAGGNHGGSGPGETEPALVFISPKFKDRAHFSALECPTIPKSGTEFHFYHKVQQSDLVPTLAALMKFPVPKNSLGVLIPELASIWHSQKAHARFLLENAMQIRRIVEAKVGASQFNTQIADAATALEKSDKIEPSLLESLPYKWAIVEHTFVHDGLESSIAPIQDFLIDAQSYLSNVASLYDIPKMLLGAALAGVAVVLTLFALPNSTKLSLAPICFGAVTALYGVMMFASSYVEEEQHLWYWLTPAWTVLLAISAAVSNTQHSSRSKVFTAALVILVVHRFAVRWNQTGQKHAGGPDIVHDYFPHHHVLMWILILLAYMYTGFQIMYTTLSGLVTREVAATVAAALILPAIGFKLNFTQADAPELVQGLAQQMRAWAEAIDLVRQAQITFTLLGLVTAAVVVLAIFGRRFMTNASRVTLSERLHHLLTLFLMTQTRAPNIPLFLGLEIQRRALNVLVGTNTAQSSDPTSTSSRIAVISPTRLALSTLLFSHVYFFCMGGSNSISSLDLSNAYNGVGDYNAIAVGVLLFAGNWAGPIWWCSAAVLCTFLTHPASSAPVGDRTWIERERAQLAKDAIDESHQSQETAPAIWLAYVANMTIFMGVGLVAVMLTCTVLRTHLFIWTVFSPKYLYSMAWCAGWHLLVNILLGGSLEYLGQVA